MAVISMPGTDPWKVASWAFRQLVATALEQPLPLGDRELLSMRRRLADCIWRDWRLVRQPDWASS